MADVPITVQAHVADELKDEPTVGGKALRERKQRLKHSNFYITINTNKRFQEAQEGLREFVTRFKATLAGIFDNIVNYIVINEQGVEWDTKYICGVNNEYTIERGGKNETIHCHALVRITHRTSVSLDYKKLRTKVQEDMDLPSIHLHIKLYRSAHDALQNYLHKDVEGSFEMATPIKID